MAHLLHLANRICPACQHVAKIGNYILNAHLLASIRLARCRPSVLAGNSSLGQGRTQAYARVASFVANEHHEVSTHTRLTHTFAHADGIRTAHIRTSPLT